MKIRTRVSGENGPLFQASERGRIPARYFITTSHQQPPKCLVRPVFFAFDLLWLNNTDLRQTPLIERKKKLRRLIEGSDCSEIIYAQHVERDGKLLFEEVCEQNLEGIVCKRRMHALPKR